MVSNKAKAWDKYHKTNEKHTMSGVCEHHCFVEYDSFCAGWDSCKALVLRNLLQNVNDFKRESADLCCADTISSYVIDLWESLGLEEDEDG